MIARTPFHTHGIARIAELLAQEHPLRKGLAKLDSLTGAATARRCPDTEGELPKPPEPREIRTALKQIKNTEAEIRDWLSAS